MISLLIVLELDRLYVRWRSNKLWQIVAQDFDMSATRTRLLDPPDTAHGPRPRTALAVGVNGEGKKYSWTKDAETGSDVDK